MGRPPKRKAAEVESTSKEVFSNTDSAGSAKKTKKNQVLPTATSSRPRRVSYHKSPSSEPPISNEAANDSVILPIKRGRGRPKKETPKIVAPVAKPVGKTKVAERDVAPEVPKNHSISQVKPKTKPTSTKPPHVQRTNKKAKAKTAHLETAEGGIDGDDDELSYWLMKAEPESRIENGYDVKFSIDDLKAAETPEPWDGVRNPVARNNMRTMMKGDLAFFYHSNCKVPGIVGIMEVVEEHSVDETAFNPSHPYFDPKSTREKPKWCVVHVTFKRKFKDIIPLSDLRGFARSGGVLEQMQMLKQSRLSVSRVSKGEWDFILGLVEDDEGQEDGGKRENPHTGRAVAGEQDEKGKKAKNFAPDMIEKELATEKLTNDENEKDEKAVEKDEANDVGDLDAAHAKGTTVGHGDVS